METTGTKSKDAIAKHLESALEHLEEAALDAASWPRLRRDITQARAALLVALGCSREEGSTWVALEDARIAFRFYPGSRLLVVEQHENPIPDPSITFFRIRPGFDDAVRALLDEDRLLDPQDVARALGAIGALE